MKYSQKQQIVDRIISGELYWPPYIIKSPDRVLINKARIYREELLEDNKYEDWLQGPDKILQVDMERGNSLKRDLEKAKISLYKGENEKYTRQVIKALNRNIDEFYGPILYLETFTLDGYLDKMQQEFILEKCVYDEEGNNVQLSDGQLQKLIFFFNSNQLSIPKFRELARTDPWRSIWNIKKGDSFGKPAIELTEEQRTLAMFSAMYDHIYENAECPPKEVIDDDDKLDGWILLQSQEREKEKQTANLENRFSKHKSADELFVVTDSADKAKEINEWNDARGVAVQNIRKKMIAEKGRVQDHEMPDKKKEILMKANQQFAQSMRR